MKLPSPRTLLLTVLVASLIPMGFISAAGPDESQAIIKAARSYMAANSAVASPEIRVETVQENFARVRVVPKTGETDPATLFLVKKDGAWKGVLLGTAFEPEDYDEFHIPANLRVP